MLLCLDLSLDLSHCFSFHLELSLSLGFSPNFGLSLCQYLSLRHRFDLRCIRMRCC